MDFDSELPADLTALIMKWRDYANALKRSMEEERAAWEYEEKAEEADVVSDITVESPADYTSTIARARALMAKNN